MGCLYRVVQPESLLQRAPQLPHIEPLGTKNKKHFTLEDKILHLQPTEKYVHLMNILSPKVKKNSGRKIIKLPVIRKVITIPEMKYSNSIFLLVLIFFKNVSLFSSLLLKCINTFHFNLLRFDVRLPPPKVCLSLCYDVFCDAFLQVGLDEIYIDVGRGWSV